MLIVVILFMIVNVFFFVISVAGKSKFGYCTAAKPNIKGGLIIKGLLLLFDIMIFVLYCCSWCIKDLADDEEDPILKNEMKYFK